MLSGKFITENALSNHGGGKREDEVYGKMKKRT